MIDYRLERNMAASAASQVGTTGDPLSPIFDHLLYFVAASDAAFSNFGFCLSSAASHYQ